MSDFSVPPHNAQNILTKSAERFRKIRNRNTLWHRQSSREYFQQIQRPSQVRWHINLSLFLPSSDLEGLQHHQQDWKITGIYKVLESPSSNPENANCIQDTFLWIPYITHQERRIEPRTRWIRTSIPHWRLCKPPFPRNSTSGKYGKQYHPEDPVPPISIGTAEILQQVHAQNKELMQIISASSGKSVRKSTNRPPSPYNRPCQGNTCHPMPAYSDKYCWTHGRCSHKGGNCNSKSPGHKDNAKM